MYECFNCGELAVVLESTHKRVKKIVYKCRCENCGAEIKYVVPIKEAEEDISKVKEFFSKSEEHVENEHLVEEFDEQRFEDENEEE